MLGPRLEVFRDALKRDRARTKTARISPFGLIEPTPRGQAFPEVAKFELIDYKVRILDQGHGTDAITRVLIETTDGESSWVTVGVGANVIEASWGALVDGLTFGLRRHHR